jgi:hypothetical protein
MSEIRRAREDLHDEHLSGRPPLDDIDAKIVVMLEKRPFESARRMAEILGVDHVTVLNHLQQQLGFKSFCLRWVPHLLKNCSIHTSTATKQFMETRDMVSMRHPPYSMDLAPSDFYLFRTVKQRLELAHFSDEKVFFEK